MKNKALKRSSPIPRNAKKVFSGVLFDVYQWQQKLFDGAFTTFEALKRRNSVNVIAITSEEKFIILDQEQPGKDRFLGLAGGQIDPKETAEQAARRELLEETGYEAESFELWDQVRPASKMDWTVYTFIARGCRKVAKQHLDGGEKIRVKLMSLEDFLKTINSSKFREKEIVSKFLNEGFMQREWTQDATKKSQKLFLS